MTGQESRSIKGFTAIAGIGTGLATIVVWLLHFINVDFPPAVDAAIAGGVASLTVYVVDHGLLGVGHLIWRGRDYVEEHEEEQAAHKREDS